MASSSNPPRLLSLPNELLSAIGRQLPNRDVKSLRLTCSRLEAVISLRLDRVFLSANPRNVDVFNAVGHHDVFRQQVIEIVWDDALLAESDASDQGEAWPDLGLDDDDTEMPEDIPNWFIEACKDNLADTINAIMFRPKPELPSWTRGPMLPINECWAHYQQLLQQQRDILQSKAHVRAFEDAWRLRYFPAVRTITITPATYGRLFYPLFETPMIRALPPGFNCPLPRGWPDADHSAPAWDNEGTDYDWPGFRIVTSVVAQHPHDLIELRVDSFQLETGLNVRVFEEPCRALQDLTTITTRPSFQHLHLDLHVSGQQHDDAWSALTSGYLARMLAEAKLQSISIGADYTGRLYAEPPHPVPLRAIFRPSSVVNLRHFGLSRFHVLDSELLELLAQLPPSLRTVELNGLTLLGTNFRRLLERIRDELAWKEVRVKIGQKQSNTHGQVVWIDADDFLYRGGNNPFTAAQGDMIGAGFGTEKDVFHASFESPRLDYAEMVACGYNEWREKLTAIEWPL